MSSPARTLDPVPADREERAVARARTSRTADVALRALAARARGEATRDGARIVAESEVPAGGE